MVTYGGKVIVGPVKNNRTLLLG